MLWGACCHAQGPKEDGYQQSRLHTSELALVPDVPGRPEEDHGFSGLGTSEGRKGRLRTSYGIQHSRRVGDNVRRNGEGEGRGLDLGGNE